MKNVKTFKYLLAFSFLLVCAISFGQGFPDGGEPCGGPFAPCPVPVDGGLSFLIAAGAVYGGKKIHDLKKRK